MTDRAGGGLSPRVRGNPVATSVPPCAVRSIPACAGEPRPVPRSARGTSVYPRVCGGTLHSPGTLTRGMGLSPRVRGNLASDLIHVHGRRSIPACAGEPGGGAGAGAGSGVYPRVCGGTPLSAMVPIWKFGLSPRVRGNPIPLAGDRACDRSIPACAGEPHRAQTATGPRQVYPRVCGGT